jgi:hypothetical protein
VASPPYLIRHDACRLQRRPSVPILGPSRALLLSETEATAGRSQAGSSLRSAPPDEAHQNPPSLPLHRAQQQPLSLS